MCRCSVMSIMTSYTTNWHGCEKQGTFSGGMKRRLSVAISAIGDPMVIFMDEPVGNEAQYLDGRLLLTVITDHWHGPWQSSLHLGSHSTNEGEAIGYHHHAQYGGG